MPDVLCRNKLRMIGFECSSTSKNELKVTFARPACASYRLSKSSRTNFLSHFILIILLLITYLSKMVPNLRLFKPVRGPWISLRGIIRPFSLLHAQWTTMLQCSEPFAPGRVAKLVLWQISRRRHMPWGCRDVPATRILTNRWPWNS